MSVELKIKEMSAGEICTRAISILNFEYNIEAWRQNNIAIRGRKFTGRKGIGDIIGFHRKSGKMCMCEVKKIGDTFKKEQIEMLTNVKEAGGLVFYATQEGLRVVVKKF